MSFQNSNYPSSNNNITKARPLSSLSSTVSIELEHAIGFSVQCLHPLHYIKKPSTTNNHNNNNNNNNNNYEPTTTAAATDAFDYITICGSRIVLEQFNNPHGQQFLRGHVHNISCCAVSNNKQLIASAEYGPNPDILIWNVNKSVTQPIYKFEEHPKGVACMAFSDDSRFLASVGNSVDNKLFIWDMNTGYIVTTLMTYNYSISDITFGGRVKDIKKRPTVNYLFGSCGLNEVRIWSLNPQNGKILSEKCKTLNLQRNFQCISFSPSGDLLLCGTQSGDFFVFDVFNLSALTKYETGVGGISSLIVLPMINPVIHDTLNSHFFIRIFAATGDGCVSLWEFVDDLQKFIQLKKISVSFEITCMDYCPSVGAYIGGGGGSVGELLIGTKTGLIYKCADDGNRGGLNQNNVTVEISHETSSIISVRYPLLRNVGNHNHNHGGNAPQRNSEQFVTVSRNGSIRRWNANTYDIELLHKPKQTQNTQQRTGHGHHNNRNGGGAGGGGGRSCASSSAGSSSLGVAAVSANCFDFNEEIILVGWNDGYIHAYNYHENNDQLWSIKDAHKSGVSCIQLAYNEKYIVSAGINGELRVWDIRFRKLITHLKEHTSRINALCLYSDSRHAVSASRDRSIICWDFNQQKRISCHRQNMGSINDIVMTGDESVVVSVGGNRAITYWDLRQTQPIYEIPNAHASELTCVQVSNDEKYLCTAATDNYFKLWDLKSRQLVTQQKIHCQKINGLCFSGDDKQIVTVGEDASILLWNVFQM